MSRIVNILLAGVFILTYSFPILGQIEPKLQNFGSQDRVSISTSRDQDNVTQYNEIKEMIQLSEFIVVGNVNSAYSYWGTDSLIWTRYSFSVNENLKSSTLGAFTMVQKGGEVGRIGMICSNSFPFSQGKNYLLFLKYDFNRSVIPIDTRGVMLLEKNNLQTNNMLRTIKSVIQKSKKEAENETR